MWGPCPRTHAGAKLIISNQVATGTEWRASRGHTTDAIAVAAVVLIARYVALEAIWFRVTWKTEEWLFLHQLRGVEVDIGSAKEDEVDVVVIPRLTTHATATCREVASSANGAKGFVLKSFAANFTFA